MKPVAPRRIAVYITLSFLALTILFILVNNLFANGLLVLIIAVPIFTVITFFVVNYFLNSFIYAKIKPIYKTIHNFKPATKDFSSLNDDIFSEVNKEVNEWMKGKTLEVQELRQLEKYRKEFLGNVSHELKTPVFNIQGYILTLLEGGIDDPNINMLYLKRTEKSIDRMISIISDLEAIAKLESGELAMQKERFNLYNLIEDVFEMQEIRAKDRKISLKFGKSVEKGCYVYADRTRIFQVISNLVVNSINYGVEGGLTTVSYYDMDKAILVQVRDNGIGMPESELPRIFERFYRLDKSRSREQGGTGLGLAIAKHIIEAHGQTINVTSSPGKGSSFTFSLEKPGR
jgi:two-component system phosphate regulon sensor histidine kinase PhoR